MNTYKRLVGKWNKMCKDFFRWIWGQCKDIKTLLLLGIVSLVMYSPALVGWIVGFVFDVTWAWVAATAYAAFWMGPFSPFFLIAVTVTLSIKRVAEVIFKKKHKAKDGTEAAVADPEEDKAQAADTAQDEDKTPDAPGDKKTDKKYTPDGKE